jgi:50S ribosomal protein L4
MSAQKIKESIKSKNNSAAFKAVTTHDLGIDVPKKSVTSAAFAVNIRQLLQNWRQGTVGCKDRSEVNLTGKKPFKQKGTGRARCGTPRSPLWRKGGIIFGPQPRVRMLKISANQKKGVFNYLFWQRLEEGKIGYLPWSLSQEAPKTAQAFNALKEAHALKGHTVVFVPHMTLRIMLPLQILLMFVCYFLMNQMHLI